MKEKLKPMSQAFVKNALGLDGIINALSRNTTPTPPESPIPPGPDTLPEYDIYVMITDNSYESMGEKCLLGFNLGPDTVTYDGGRFSRDPHFLKQTNIDPNFQFAASLPEELQSYWEGYGEYPGGANFFTIYTGEGSDPLPYGFDISVTKYSFNFENDDEYGCDMSCSWGDSNSPYVVPEIISKAEAEEFYNS